MAIAMSMTMFRMTLCQGIEKFETFLKIKKKWAIILQLSLDLKKTGQNQERYFRNQS